MAQRVRIELTDDILGDGTPADETLTFALDGVTYELDLSAENAVKLRDQLAPWMGVARRVAGRKPATGKRGKASGSASPNEIRTWARSQGMEVSERGRVRDDIKAAYEAAHN